jgi:hypothetical protein
MVLRLSSIAFWALALFLLCFVTLSSADTPRYPHSRFLNQPPTILRAAVHGLLTQYKRKGHQLDKHIDDILVENPRLKKEF